MSEAQTTTYPWERAVVIGASSGIGEQLARQLAAAGAQVALVARRIDRLTGIAQDLNAGTGREIARAYSHDVRDWHSTSDLFRTIAADLGGVDLVIYCAGILPKIGEREYPVASDVDVIETNFVGAVAWLDEAAARFDVMGEGTIVGISSVAGDRGRVGNPVYNAAKAGLDTYLEALRARLARRGVVVLTVKPGFTRTAQVEGVTLPDRLVTSPEAVARQALAAAAAKKRVAYTPGWWRWIMFAVRLIPAPVFERLRV